MLPTLAAAAGEPDVVGKLKKGYKSGNKTFKVYIDGFNLLPFLKGEVKENPRKAFLYSERRRRSVRTALRELEGDLSLNSARTVWRCGSKLSGVSARPAAP